MLFRIVSGVLPFLSVASISIAGTLPLQVSSRAYTTERGIWNLFGNPAGLSGVNRFSSGVFYRSPFMLDQVSHRGVSAAIPLGSYAVGGLGLIQYGYELYREQQAALSVSRNFGGVVAAGVRFDYLSEAYGRDYGRTSCFTGSAGMIARLTSELDLGVSVFNPQRVSQGDERKPSVIGAGLSWTFGQTAVVHADFSKSTGLPGQFSAGTRYRVSPKFTFSAGLSSGAERFYFGYFFSAGRMHIGMASGYHGQLGFSPSIELTFK